MNYRKWILIALIPTLLIGCESKSSSGDRVLVTKCSYDNGFTEPDRYQVVVFKYPKGPIERNTPKNYIKRLMGLPGELLAIFFGRLYRWTPPQKDAPPPYDDVNDKKINRNDLWNAQFMHTNDEKTRNWFEEGQFEILRKTPRIMLALRRIVYDNDFQAKDLKGKLDRWSPDAKAGWKSDKDTGFAHEGADDGQFGWLRYQHLIRPDGPIVGGGQEKPRLITDTMAYNSFKIVHEERDRNGVIIRSTVSDKTPSHPHWVGDLMIECNVEVVQPKGEFCLELSKGIYRYQACWDFATGKCTLYRVGSTAGKEEKKELASQPTSVKSPGNYMLRLANIDARLTVWVDSALPFGDGHDYDPPEVRGKSEKDLDIGSRRGPTENDLKPASIGSKGAQVKVAHVRLWRDTYYTSAIQQPDYAGDMPREAWAEPSQWETLRKQRFATMYVQPGHFLCLGDNSQASSDSRDWGLVPERLMLGRALLVYFPLDRVGRIR